MPTDQNILTTEEEKVEKYKDLALEIKRIHRAARVTLIPILIGARNYLEECKGLVWEVSPTCDDDHLRVSVARETDRYP